MKWMLLVASAVVAAGLCLPGQAAQPTAQPAAPAEAQPAAPAAAGDPITFEQYREWRLRYIERRQTQLAAQLATGDLQPRQRARLEQAKAYFDWFAGLPAADRDRRFRARFDQIDANHDGTIDPGDRAAWHDKQRAFYGRARGGTEPAAARETR
jgi:hypothetical protein